MPPSLSLISMSGRAPSSSASAKEGGVSTATRGFEVRTALEVFAPGDVRELLAPGCSAPAPAAIALPGAP